MTADRLARHPSAMLSRSPFRRWSKRIRRHRDSVILMYHRIIDAESDPWGLAVSPDNFRTHLRELKRSRPVLAMDDLVAGLSRDDLPRGAVAITFDDGYVDNLRNALPALREENLPATLFLATGPTLHSQHYWWDELAARILDASGPIRIREEIGGIVWELEFGPREPADECRKGWRAWETPRTQRESVYYRCWDRLRGLAFNAREDVMRRFRELLPGELHDRDRPMTPDEVRELTADSLVGLGGHTVDHVDLLEVDRATALAQMRTGKEQAEAMTGKPLKGFAYPYGRAEEPLEDLAAQAGFEWACDTRNRGVSSHNLRRYRLPRIGADDQPNISFLA